MKRMPAWIKKAIVSLVNDDSSDSPTVQCTHNGVTTDANRFSPYGLSANPPKGAATLILSPSGRQDDPIALTDDQARRFKDLQEGEVEVGNPLTRTSIKFDRDKNMRVRVTEDGDLIVDVLGGDARISVAGNLSIDRVGTIDVQATGDVTLEAPNVTINGNLTVTGTITGQSNVLGGPANTSLASHVHTSATPGNPTSPPT